MSAVAAKQREWWDAGRPFVRATVVSTWGSAPLPVGSAMLIGPGDEVLGGVSGGCVEAAVHLAGQEVLTSGVPALERYGVSDEEAHAVGLTCGGTIEVFVERVSAADHVAGAPTLVEVDDDVAAARPVAVATVVADPDPACVGRRVVVHAEGTRGSTGSPGLDDAVVTDARALLEAGLTRCVSFGAEGGRQGDAVRVFVHSHAPRPRLIVFGATEFAVALTRIGRFLDRRVTLCDARTTFATRSRFADADDVVVDWPHRYLEAQDAAGLLDHRTAVAVLTHDPKFDVPVLITALRVFEQGRLGYVGMMGSRRTRDDRFARLREAGVDPALLERIRSPIGLDIGAATPEETAVSIAAEMIADRGGRHGAALSQAGRPIHDLRGR